MSAILPPPPTRIILALIDSKNNGWFSYILHIYVNYMTNYSHILLSTTHTNVVFKMAQVNLWPLWYGCYMLLNRPSITFNIYATVPVFSYTLRYIVDFGLVDFGLAEMAISTNPKPPIYRNLYTHLLSRYFSQSHYFSWTLNGNGRRKLCHMAHTDMSCSRSSPDLCSCSHSFNNAITIIVNKRW